VTSLAAAYSATGAAWQHGPGRVYERLAEVLADRSPLPLRGCRVLDVGAGTGAAGRAAQRAGAGSVIAIDVARGMLAHDAAARPPAAVADALALPFRDGAFDVAIAAFSLNHVAHPAAGLREMMRAVRRGGAIVVGAYAADDSHPVKAAVEDVLRSRGWEPEPWYLSVRSDAVPKLATVERCAEVARTVALEATC
jgi:ubiquinone/menaquinone biosynthesis C-methylase UbiE